jgi:hypothetical protein
MDLLGLRHRPPPPAPAPRARQRAGVPLLTTPRPGTATRRKRPVPDDRPSPARLRARPRPVHRPHRMGPTPATPLRRHLPWRARRATTADHGHDPTQESADRDALYQTRQARSSRGHRTTPTTPPPRLTAPPRATDRTRCLENNQIRSVAKATPQRVLRRPRSEPDRSKSCACVTGRRCVGQRRAEAEPTDTRRRLASEEGACDAVAGADHKAVFLCPDLTVHADDASVEVELTLRVCNCQRFCALSFGGLSIAVSAAATAAIASVAGIAGRVEHWRAR